MKRVLPVLAWVLLAAACNKPVESLQSRLQKATQIEIDLYGEAVSASGPLVLTSPADIDSLSNMVTEVDAGELKCMYDGRIVFKKADSVLFAGEFNLAKDCAHISYKTGDLTQFRKLSPGALATLTQLKTSNEKSKIDDLKWFLGRWMQTEGPDLVSYEEWKRVSPSLYQGLAWTIYHSDTVHVETIDLSLEGQDLYYIPTVEENEGPVRFKMSVMSADSVLFENPEHDFPQKITYIARGDSMILAKISGAKNGKPLTKEFPLHRVVR